MGVRAPLVVIWMEGLLVILVLRFLCTRTAHVVVGFGIDPHSTTFCVVVAVEHCPSGLDCMISGPVSPPILT